mmetsp:Transcript_38103/g.84896  ORF Transcript_38103/g.84896 Transcript_38103/m.84896 type:complete len:93 (-) Transcript_38103:741-1019(-)
MSAEEAKVKPEPEAGIELIVKDQDGAEVRFKVKKTVRLEKVFNIYCQKKGKQRKEIRFLFDGHHLQDDTSADAAGLEDGDVIDAVIEQLGGR